MADEPPAAGPSPTQQPDPPDFLSKLTGADANASAAAPGAADAAAATTPETNTPATPAGTVAAAPPPISDPTMPDQAMIDELLKQAEFEDPSTLSDASAESAGAGASGAGAAPATESFEMPNFQQVMADAQVSSIDLLRDVELNVKIELGRSRMLVEDVLKLGEGSVVELDKLAGDPVDVFVNDRLVARGEVLVLNENFCVRVNEIVAGLKDEGV